jgi:hypothetical protein
MLALKGADQGGVLMREVVIRRAGPDDLGTLDAGLRALSLRTWAFEHQRGDRRC